MYNIEPNISHLKVFRCLCFATVLDNSDKLSSRSEKSVFIGYSFEKKFISCLVLKVKRFCSQGMLPFMKQCFLSKINLKKRF